MSNLHSHLLVKISDSKTDNCVVLGNIRISVITDKLIRVEVSKDSNFCDLPTQKVWHRAFTNATFDCKDNGKFITVKTQSTQFDIDKSGNIVYVILADGRRVKDCRKGNLKGTIIPLADCKDNSIKNPDSLQLWVYSGNGQFTLYEDDGESYNYLKGEFAERTFTVSENQNTLNFVINPSVGDKNIGKDRNFTLKFKDIADCKNITATLNGNPIDIVANTKCYVQCEIFLKATDKLVIEIESFNRISNGTINQNIVNIFSKYQYKNGAKTMVYNKFKKVNTKEDLQKALNGLAGHKRLKSQLKELLYMAF